MKDKILFNNTTNCKRILKKKNEKSCILRNKILFLQKYFKQLYPNLVLTLLGDEEFLSSDLNNKDILNTSDKSLNDDKFYHLYKSNNSVFYNELPNKIKKIINYINTKIPQDLNKNKIGNILLRNIKSGKKTKQHIISSTLGTHRLGLINKNLIKPLMDNNYGGSTKNNTILYWKVLNINLQMFSNTTMDWWEISSIVLTCYLIAKEKIVLIDDGESNIFNMFRYLGYNRVRKDWGNTFTQLAEGAGPFKYEDSETNKKYLVGQGWFFSGDNTYTILNAIIFNEEYSPIDYLLNQFKCEIPGTFTEGITFDGWAFSDITTAYLTIHSILTYYINYASHITLDNYTSQSDIANIPQIRKRFYTKIFEYIMYTDGINNANLHLHEYISQIYYLTASMNSSGSDPDVNTTASAVKLGDFSFNDGDSDLSELQTTNDGSTTQYAIWSKRPYNFFNVLNNGSTILNTASDDTGYMDLTIEWSDASGTAFTNGSDSSCPTDVLSNTLTETYEIGYGTFKGKRTGVGNWEDSQMPATNYWLPISNVVVPLDTNNEVNQFFALEDPTNEYHLSYGNAQTNPALDISGNNPLGVARVVTDYVFNFAPNDYLSKTSYNIYSYFIQPYTAFGTYDKSSVDMGYARYLYTYAIKSGIDVDDASLF